MFSCLIPFVVISRLKADIGVKQSSDAFTTKAVHVKTLLTLRTLQRSDRKEERRLVEPFISSRRGGYVFAPVSLLICHQDISKTFHNICWIDTSCTEMQRLIFRKWSAFPAHFFHLFQHTAMKYIEVDMHTLRLYSNWNLFLNLSCWNDTFLDERHI